MTTRLTELSILFLSLVKWFFLAGVVGLLVGLSSTLFLISLQGSLVFHAIIPVCVSPPAGRPCTLRDHDDQTRPRGLKATARNK